MALGTFLDIEGAFDNVAIEKAPNKKCFSPKTNNWIMWNVYAIPEFRMKLRSTTVEIHGNKKTLKLVRGCPQGGILSPFRWNLVVDSFLNYTKNRIACDIQGLADDLSLIAIVESP